MDFKLQFNMDNAAFKESENEVFNVLNQVSVALLWILTGIR